MYLETCQTFISSFSTFINKNLIFFVSMLSTLASQVFFFARSPSISRTLVCHTGVCFFCPGQFTRQPETRTGSFSQEFRKVSSLRLKMNAIIFPGSNQIEEKGTRQYPRKIGKSLPEYLILQGCFEFFILLKI